MGRTIVWLFRYILHTALVLPLMSGATPIDIGQVEVTADGRLLIGIDTYGERTVSGSVDGPYTGVEIASGTEASGKLTLTSLSELTAGTLMVGTTGEHAVTAPAQTALVRVEAGSSLFTSEAHIGGGAIPGSFGVEVDGAGSVWINDGQIVVAPAPGLRRESYAHVDVTGGAYLSTRNIVSPYRNARVLVDGLNSRLVTHDLWIIGGFGAPVEVIVRNGGFLSSRNTFFGSIIGYVDAIVAGSGSTWTTGDLFLHWGRIRVIDGGRLHTTRIDTTFPFSDIAAVVSVDGNGSRWDIDGELFAHGWYGIHDVRVSGGGSLESNGGRIVDRIGVPTITVSGMGSSWINRDDFTMERTYAPRPIGGTGIPEPTGRLIIDDGGVVENLTARLLSGSVRVSGRGSLWNNRGDLFVGGDERGPSGLSSVVAVLDEARARARSVTVLRDGMVSLAGGVIDAPDVRVSGGILSGGGRISGSVQNEGIVDVAGTLEIGGQFSQGSTGHLRIGIRGLTDFDVLNVGSAAFLDGILSIEWLSGVVPDFGDRFGIITWSDRVGTFNEITGLQIDPTHFLEPIYEPRGLFLQAELDSDLDRLRDHHEAVHGTDPNSPDTDGDGYGDGLEVEAGTSPTERASTPCGNGGVEGPEACDLGAHLNGSPESCCTATCRFAAAGTVCRESAGECDVAEMCTGGSALCSADGFAAAGTACGNPAQTACTDRDTCSGGGVCFANNKACAAITDADLCPFDIGENVCDAAGGYGPAPQFQLTYTPETPSSPAYQLGSSSPEVTVYNAIVVGAPGARVPVQFTVPYPYLTVGDEPLSVYDALDLGTAGTTGCFEPHSIPLETRTLRISLGDYLALCDTGSGQCRNGVGACGVDADCVRPNANGVTCVAPTATMCHPTTGPDPGGSCSFTMDVQLPASGQAYVKLQLAYGLVGPRVDLCGDGEPDRYNWGVNASRGGLDALARAVPGGGRADVAIANCTAYTFQHAAGSGPVLSATLENLNEFSACTDALDIDCDGISNEADLCPYYAGNTLTDDVNSNGIGDECECGDQDANGTVSVSDIVAIHLAIFGAAQMSPLCDTNDDGLCNVSDIVGANRKIFGRPAYCSRYPSPGP